MAWSISNVCVKINRFNELSDVPGTNHIAAIENSIIGDMQKPQSNNSSKGAALFISAMSSFLVPFMSASVNVALPEIGKQFGLDALTLNWIVTSYLLAAAMLIVPFGRIADIYGRKKIFICGIVIFMVAALVLVFSDSAIMLIPGRFLQGVGAAMIFGTGIAILTSVYPASERGKALGITAACVYIGQSAGAPLGGFLTHYFSWQSVFLSVVPLSLAIFYVAVWKLKGEWAEAKGEKIDYIGSIAYGLSLLVMIYGFSLLPETSGIVFAAIGILGIVAFIWWEARCKSPVLDLCLFKENRGFSFASLAALINYSATFAVTFLMSLYLQYVKNFSADYAGLILITQPALQAIISPVSGRLSDRIEPRFVASLGMAITTVGLILLIFLDKDTGLGFIIPSLFILGLGFALFISPNTNAAMSSVDKKFYGVASGTISTMRVLGQVVSMGIAMVVFAIFMGKVQITPESYPQFLESLKMAFIIFSILCFAGIFVSLARSNVNQRSSTE